MTPREACVYAAPALTAVSVALLAWATMVGRRPGFPAQHVLLLIGGMLSGVLAAVAWWQVSWAAGLAAAAVFLGGLTAWGHWADLGGER